MAKKPGKDKRRLLKRRARPLDAKFKQKKAKGGSASQAVSAKGTPTSKTKISPTLSSGTPSPVTSEKQHITERIHHYIRHRPSVRMDDLVATMRKKYDTSEEETWAAVMALEAKKAVRIQYPGFDRAGATVSALWQS
jgi:hypothetical protein